ncbi:MAG: hypothetical protein DHS20C02_16390 [Micavibrio sp.]|nr:MAG: hypothetical protein DHS20C02_16390 [Micavibrio sp.]
MMPDKGTLWGEDQMSVSIHYRIKELIEETNEAFDICASSGHMNTDYAEFAAMSISDFKRALGKPDLTDRQLTRMLRKGGTKYRKNTPKDHWAMFLAGYVTNQSNGNDKALKVRDSWQQRNK